MLHSNYFIAKTTVTNYVFSFFPPSLASVHDGHDYRLCPGPEDGDDGGADLSDVGDDREGEGDADDGEEDAEESAGRGCGGDVAVAHRRHDGGGEEHGLHVRPLVRALIF